MSINYELMRILYPEWEPQSYPFQSLLLIFMATALFLIVPYIYIRFIEERLTLFIRLMWWRLSLRHRIIKGYVISLCNRRGPNEVIL